MGGYITIKRTSGLKILLLYQDMYCVTFQFMNIYSHITCIFHVSWNYWYENILCSCSKNYFILFSFEFRLRICLAADGHLIMISRIRNVNGKPFSFSFAYHTYFSISDIRSVCYSSSFKIRSTSINISRNQSVLLKDDFFFLHEYVLVVSFKF